MAEHAETNRDPAERPIRILVVDDHKIVADAICTLLEVTGDIEIVGRVYESSKIRQSIVAYRPDIVLCDLEMPGEDPLEACIDGIAESTETKIVVLTAFPTDAHIARAVGVHVAGFMTKHEPAETVVDGIRAIAAGHEVYSDEVRERMMSNEENTIRESKILALSPRELTIVRLVAQGLTTGQIAETVYRSPKTVDNQISSAFVKTGCSNRVELSRWAIREGLVQA
ncbi:MAG: response regulator transcription factor [Phycisphaerales bacterium]|nr:response regulator transcription factor [Phycisphaerales bacterium]